MGRKEAGRGGFWVRSRAETAEPHSSGARVGCQGDLSAPAALPRLRWVGSHGGDKGYRWGLDGAAKGSRVSVWGGGRLGLGEGDATGQGGAVFKLSEPLSWVALPMRAQPGRRRSAHAWTLGERAARPSCALAPEW